jgi:hypothetical protein
MRTDSSTTTGMGRERRGGLEEGVSTVVRMPLPSCSGDDVGSYH